MAARSVRDAEAAGSNPAVPTTKGLIRGNVEVVNLDCGHWIQQEEPEETSHAILKWLEQQDAA